MQAKSLKIHNATIGSTPSRHRKMGAFSRWGGRGDGTSQPTLLTEELPPGTDSLARAYRCNANVDRNLPLDEQRHTSSLLRPTREGGSRVKRGQTHLGQRDFVDDAASRRRNELHVHQHPSSTLAQLHQRPRVLLPDDGTTGQRYVDATGQVRMQPTK